jgi:hypothetical protein
MPGRHTGRATNRERWRPSLMQMGEGTGEGAFVHHAARVPQATPANRLPASSTSGTRALSGTSV